MADYKTPQWLLPNEKNLAYPAAGAETGSGLSEDRHSLYSMNFDGSNYIDLGTDLDIFRYNINESYTVSLWYKATATLGFNTIINLGANSYRFCLLSATLGRITFGAGNSSTITVTYNWMPTAGAINDGNWHHICIVQDSSGGSVNLTPYVDGSPSGSAAGTTAAITENNNRIGDGHYGGVEAGIDEVAIFNRALDSTEIAALYGGTSPDIYPSNVMALNEKPIAYYPLGEQAQMGSANWSFPNGSLQNHVIDFNTSDIELDNIVNLGTTWTISFWIKTTSSLISNQTILAAGSGNGFTMLLLRNNRLMLYRGTGADYNYFFTNGEFNDGEWHNITLVRNGTKDIIPYLDGSIGSYYFAAGSGNLDTNMKFIGDDGGTWGTATPFNGKLSNVAIWNSDQTTNIDDIYNNGSPQSSYTTTPTAWWKLNATSNYAGLNPNFHDALDFNGTSDYINASATGINNTITVSAWINTSTTGIQTIVNEDQASGANRCWNLLLEPGNKIQIVIKNTDGTVNNKLRSTALEVQDGKWHHIAFTYDGTADADGLKTYVDGGNLESFQLSSTGISTTDTLGTFIGTLQGNNGWRFTGKISNVSIFNQVISAEDVLYLYNGGTPQTSLSFEPLSWWKLDNLTTGIEDSGSGGNDGTNNGATAVSSSVAVDQWNFDNVSQAQTPNWSSALSFDGSSDYIDLDPGVMKTFTSDNLSISCWLKADVLGTYNYVYADGHTSGNKVVSLNYASVRGGLEFAVGNGSVARASGVAINTGEWYHVVCTYAAGGDLKFYLNGNTTPVATATFSGALDLAGHTVSAIGRSNIHSSHYWDGEISNVQVWNTELGTSDVTTLYNSGQPQSTASLSPKSWYKLDNTTTGIQDSGSAGINGTNNGATETQTNVWTPRLNGESTTLPSTALVTSDLQFESPYSNYSLSFDGTSSFMGTTESILPSAGDMTVSAWVKLNDTTSLQGIFESANYYTTGFNGGFGLRANGVGLSAAFSNGTSFVYNIEPAGFTIGDWFHVAFTFNNTSKLGTYYVNGSSIGTYTFNSAYDNADLVNGAELGRVVKNSGYILNGNLDEVSVFSSVLTQAQITQIYNNSYPADLTSLSPASWWRLGEDAYFVGNTVTIPNKVVGGATMSGNGTQTAILVGDAPGSYANGSGTNLAVEDRIGDAPESTANSVSINMIPSNRISYPAGYLPTQADNVYSMEFDGVNDYITSSTNGISGLNNASISVWVKPTGSTINQYKSIVNQWEAANMAWGLWLNGSGSTYRIHWNQAGASGVDSGLIIPIDEWSHIAIVKNATTLKMFYNGSEVNSFSISAATGSGATTLNIGAQYASTSALTFFNGNIDEVAIFNYALTARQIKQDIYEGTTTGKTADLNNISNLTAPVAWYRMGD